ncbi:hypothetical protein SISSUDRAFT_1040421 [Sistotremastrum suecicum HHB10207 ss-3]|uniref:Rhodopsin domain-containing protein n=1 Tax=Sistotremastrum suecicum HHB10207 ss-3 TaxID=1314776 RepID=A0A166I546_9AGAM|nr:hypothetical protein SISSUDRAFT_1040421 [Sistotremastrum suecicum HHB10207 ss-3]
MGLPDIKGVNEIGAGLAAFASCVTIFRLVFRWLKSRLWWDDAWAFFAMLNVIVTASLVWVVYAPRSSNVSQHSRVASFLILEVGFTLVIWAARLSILFTVIRITHDVMQNRLLYATAAMFCLFALILSAQKFWVCIPQSGWKDIPGASCNLGAQVAITEVVTDIIGDTVLIIAPVRLIWHIRLSKPLRVRLICVFSMSILTTLVSLVQNYFQIHRGGIRNFIVSHVEMATAVTICNLSVVVGALYRFFRHSDFDSEHSDHGQGVVTVGSANTRRRSLEFAIPSDLPSDISTCDASMEESSHPSDPEEKHVEESEEWNPDSYIEEELKRISEEDSGTDEGSSSSEPRPETRRRHSILSPF